MAARQECLAQRRYLVIQALVLGCQFVVDIQLSQHLHDIGHVQTLANLTNVLFLVGIVRAWELIGARDLGLLGVLGETVRARSTLAGPTSDEAEQPSP